MCDSNLSGFHPFDNMVIIYWVKNRLKQKGRFWVHETPILEEIFVILTENSSVIINDTQAPEKYPHHWNKLQGHTSVHNMTLKLPQYFYLPLEKPLGSYFQDWSPYCQAVQCNQKTLVPVSSRWQVRSEKAKKRISINTNYSYHQCWSS